MRCSPAQPLPCVRRRQSRAGPTVADRGSWPATPRAGRSSVCGSCARSDGDRSPSLPLPRVQGCDGRAAARRCERISLLAERNRLGAGALGLPAAASGGSARPHQHCEVRRGDRGDTLGLAPPLDAMRGQAVRRCGKRSHAACMCSSRCSLCGSARAHHERSSATGRVPRRGVLPATLSDVDEPAYRPFTRSTTADSCAAHALDANDAHRVADFCEAKENRRTRWIC
jgi:hypothetical protein